MHGIKHLFIAFLLPITVTAQGLFTSQTGSHNFIIHHPASMERNDITRLIDQFESDYQEFRYYFNLTVPGRTRVIVHSNQFSLHDATFAHSWEVGTVYNEEIHLAPIDYIRTNAALSSVITNQVVRLVLYSRLINGCPRWLYEGAAAYFAGVHQLNRPPHQINISYPSDLNEIFTNPHSEREFNDGMYLAALSFKAILERYGEAHSITLLRLFNGEFAYEEAVPYSLGVTLKDFKQQWRRDVQRLLSEFQDARER